MTVAKILYYHNAEYRDYMLKTKLELSKINETSEFDVIDCVTKKDSNDMGLKLGENWNKGNDLFIVGQDNVPDVNMLLEMKYCTDLLCVNPCISFPASTALDRPVLNQINDKGKIYEMNDRPKRAWYGGTGISKISLRFQYTHNIPDFDFGFPRFDSELYRYGLKDWHCHYPIHEHTKDKLEYAHWDITP